MGHFCGRGVKSFPAIIPDTEKQNYHVPEEKTQSQIIHMDYLTLCLRKKCNLSFSRYII